MDRGKDISQKLRSAIKAKLIELNAYVDDELPDYIMVMVANKKSKDQMTDDLGLFLTQNTEKFTDWLHSLLGKLQTLGSDPQKSKEEDKPQNKEKPDKDGNQTVPSGKEKTSAQRKPTEKTKPIKEKSLVKEDESEKRTPAEKETESLEKSTAVGESTSTLSKPVTARVVASKVARDTKASVPEEEYVPELLENRGETDEFSEEYRDEPEVKRVRPQRAVESQKMTSKLPPTKHGSGSHSGASRAATGVTTAELRARLVHPKSATDRPITSSVHSRLGVAKYRESGVRAKTRLEGSPTERSVQKVEYTSNRRVSPLKRKQPSSVVAAVKKKYEEEDEEEEYDPYNPAVGNVASVVRVTARRSSVPLSQQANKNLILKATAEAEKSVTSNLKRVLTEEKMYSEKEKGIVKPLQHRKSKPVTVTLHGKGLVSKSRREELVSAVPTKSLRLEAVKPISTKSYRDDKATASRSRSQMNQIVKNMTYTIQNTQTRKSTEKMKSTNPPRAYAQEVARVSPTKDSRHILQVSKKDEEEVVVEGGESDDQDDALHDVDDKKEDVHKYEIKTPSPLEFDQLASQSDSSPEIDSTSSPDLDPESRLIIQGSDLRLDLDEAEATEYLEDPVLLSEEEDAITEDIISSRLEEEEESEEKLRQEALRHRQQRQQIFQQGKVDNFRSKPVAEVAPVDTRFIVTLDGVDPLPYKETQEEEIVQVKSVTPAKKSPITKITPPEVSPISINLKDTDDEEEETAALPSNIAKKTEKCRFWPACVNGNACPYHHPTVPCKMFPSCKFGDKCLYIHPNCKFDSKCSRKDCPFTHASKRNNLTTVIQKIIPVPVPTAALATQFVPGKTSPICKFFPNCRNVQCPFQHPKPCRFGVNCINKSQCSFYHPSTLPSKDKLRWTASSQPTHKSNRLFDAGKAVSMPTSIK